MLLATVLIVGFIGISSPPSIFAQEYYDDYEAEYSHYYDDYETEYNNYEKYIKDDGSRPISQTISCNNINNNDIDFGDATNDEAISSSGVSPSFGNGDSQPDKKGDFVDSCLNNNNIKVITNNFNTGTTINNNNLNIERNNALTQDITQSNEACTNTVVSVEDEEGNQDVDAEQSNACTVTQSNAATGIEEDNNFNDFPGVITSSSIANGGEPQGQTQHVKVLQDGSGVEITQQGNQPLDIRQIKSSQDGNGIEIQQQELGDSSELTATEKIDKLKTQYVELYQ